MSRCQYCRCEVPGLVTLCDECFEKGCDRIAHPTSWWQRFRLTYNSLCVFLFVFIYVYITTAVNRDNHPTMVGLVVLALILAAGLILIAFAFRDSHKPRVAHRGLYSFLILFLYFFFRLWQVSSYHPLPNRELWAFVAATIAGIVESFRADPGRTSGSQNKAPGESGAFEKNSRDAV